VANGAHTVKAVASDAAGNTATSTRTVTVANPDITAPSVSLTGPANGATVSGTVSLSAAASDNVGVAGVKFLVDGAPVGVEDTTSPYGVSWNTTLVSNGTHTLTAVARDAAGNATTSSARTVTVANPDITAPSVSLAAPNGGAPVSGTVSLNAAASDNVGVANVKFYVDNTVLVTDSTSPYSASWNTTAVVSGAHTVKAVASDAAGNTATSTVNVTVDNTKPTVTLAAPNNGAPVSGTVTLSATASDNAGVAGVQFMVDGTALGAEDSGSPYSASWNTTTVTNGTHTLAAVARDTAGNTTTSTVTVTVTNQAPTTNYVVSPVTVGTGPSGVAVTNGLTYVINYDSNNVTVVDTATNEFVKNIDVGSGPLSVAASEQSKRVYVSNSLDNSVSVIDAVNNTVVDTIQIDVPSGYIDNPEAGRLIYDNKVTELAVNREGTRLYVNATDGSVRVIDTDPASANYNTVIGTAYLGRFNDLKVSPDGTRLYGTPGVGLTVIDTATMTAVGVQVGPVWDHDAMESAYTDSTGNIAISPDGKRVYVAYSATTVARGTGGHTSGSFITDAQGVTWMITGGSGGVSIIDTDPASANYNKEIGRVAIPNWAQDLVVSGGKLYVTEWDDMSVTVIDTATNAIVGSFTTDQTRSSGRSLWVVGYYEWYPDYVDSVFPVAAFSRYITAGPDGEVYVTDYGGGAMYVVTPSSPSV
jgi:YVTN family beta-propeller protein